MLQISFVPFLLSSFAADRCYSVSFQTSKDALSIRRIIRMIVVARRSCYMRANRNGNLFHAYKRRIGEFHTAGQASNSDRPSPCVVCVFVLMCVKHIQSNTSIIARTESRLRIENSQTEREPKRVRVRMSETNRA